MHIETLADLGPLLRDERKRQRLTLEDVMFAASVSKTFLLDVEAGKPTCQFDRVLRVANVIGVSLESSITPTDGDE